MSTAPVISINQNNVYQIPVLIGAANELVGLREKKNVYNVNPHIKYWATWFLLKSFTTSGRIQAWNKQKRELLEFLRMSDGSLRNQLYKLQQLKLISIEKSAIGRDRDLVLTSYKEAAGIMGIIYKGTEIINYKPHEYANESQVFRYLLTAKEIESNQQLQTDELFRKFQKNCSGHTTEILLQLSKIGANTNRCMADKHYLQQQLMKLQKIVFREQSAMASITFSLRSDTNRSCRRAAEDYKYKSHTSFSYIKKKLLKVGAIAVEKVLVNSKERSRIYYMAEVEGKHIRKDGYKWNDKAQQTYWRLCDQVTVTLSGEKKPEALKAAA